MTNKGQHWQVNSNPGPLAYFLTLIENLASGTWQENCRQYEGRQS
jgi:hypothetical protein